MATKKAAKAAAPKYHKTKSGRMARFVKDGDGRALVFVKRFDPHTGAEVDDEMYPVDIAALKVQRAAHLAEAARLAEEIEEAEGAEDAPTDEVEETTDDSK
jgi:hypothetical protein